MFVASLGPGSSSKKIPDLKEPKYMSIKDNINIQTVGALLEEWASDMSAKPKKIQMGLKKGSKDTWKINDTLPILTKTLAKLFKAEATRLGQNMSAKKIVK